MALTWASIRLGAFVTLAVASVALGVTIYDELAGESEAGPAGAASATSAQQATVPPTSGTFALPPLQSYTAVTERPLFTPSRHPATTQTSSRPASESSAIVLTGIVIAGDDKVALVADTNAGSLARYREGQTIGGWTLVTIQQDHIVIERGATRREIKLVDKSRTTPEGVPPPRNQRAAPRP
jgi:general secretion pathway protein N